jgi:hypothetical protein
LDLSVKAKSIETGNVEYLCDQLTSLETELVKETDYLSFYQNPIASQLYMRFNNYSEYEFKVFGATGQLEDQFEFKGIELKRYLKGEVGLKTILIKEAQTQKSFIIKILKFE